jgi:hypothetical protein
MIRRSHSLKPLCLTSFRQRLRDLLRLQQRDLRLLRRVLVEEDEVLEVQ